MRARTTRGWLEAALLLCVTACVIQPESHASTMRPRVAYAGLALVGAADDLPRLYPEAYSLQAELNAALFDRVKNLAPAHYDLVSTSFLRAD